ncbi:MAG: alpha/beta hydrolase [Myxococcales bacterium]|nr:alpha/beta hydrolase [Myxococcales bacterium]
MSQRAKAPVGDLEICYETFGRRGDPPLLLVMGFGGQLVAWPKAFCQALVDRGFFVVRFDNRDTGESTWLDGAPAPALPLTMTRFALGQRRLKAPYTVVDMAADAAGLIAHLDVGPMHVFGVSMGGMIAQQLALDAPARVASLTTMMSHTGRWRDHIASPRALAALLATRPTSRERAAAHFRKLFTTIGGSRFHADGAALEAIGAESFDRGINPPGIRRHMAAIIGAPERTRRLRDLQVPTLVIHGTADPLVPKGGGEHTARCIPGAKLALIEGLGHSLPPGVWGEVVDLLSEHAGACA